MKLFKYNVMLPYWYQFTVESDVALTEDEILDEVHNKSGSIHSYDDTLAEITPLKGYVFGKEK